MKLKYDLENQIQFSALKNEYLSSTSKLSNSLSSRKRAHLSRHAHSSSLVAPALPADAPKELTESKRAADAEKLQSSHEIRNLSCSLTGELFSPSARAVREECVASGGGDGNFPDSREEDEYECS